MPEFDKITLWKEAQETWRKASAGLADAALRALAASLPGMAALAMEESDQHYDGTMVATAVFSLDGERFELEDDALGGVLKDDVIDALGAAGDLFDGNASRWRRFPAMDFTARQIQHPSGSVPAEFLLDLRLVRQEVGG